MLQLVAEGHSNKEIAAVLYLSVHTIYAHRNSVMAKLNIHKQAIPPASSEIASKSA